VKVANAEQERAAASAGLGVHARGCQAPWEWRAARRNGGKMVGGKLSAKKNAE
jgi:hypothetical protein